MPNGLAVGRGSRDFSEYCVSCCPTICDGTIEEFSHPNPTPVDLAGVSLRDF
jgi:hypothetical protein